MAPVEAITKFWLKNKLLVVMGGLLIGTHMGWRWVQDQEEFVPKNNPYGWKPMEYPWFEAAKLIKNSKEESGPEGKGNKS